jgi:predicted SAM-dependent methyltransferase
MVEFNMPQGARTIELGCGESPRPEFTVHVDKRALDGVDFQVDLEEPNWPIQDSEFDGAYAAYVMEHVSWRLIKQFLGECHRILKHGGTLCVVTPNTEAQVHWALQHPEGWDGRGFFESASGLLYGDQDYPDNAHKAFLSPKVMKLLLEESGFEEVTVHPYGARQTDMCTVARRSAESPVDEITNIQAEMKGVISHQAPEHKEPHAVTQILTPQEMYDRHYFNGGHKVGGYAREGYWDYPCHEVTARKILELRPESVLELGCARGYVLKRLEDRGVRVCGLDVSEHCYLTRAIRDMRVCNLWVEKWPIKDGEFDLCFSQAFLEHVPEEHLEHVLSEMHRVSKRCLHGIDFGERDDGFDRTHCTLRPKDFWIDKFFARFSPAYPFLLRSKEELEQGPLPQDYLKGDGKVKLNAGSFTHMFHNGWVNLDIVDLRQWAAQQGYQFIHHDLKNGLPMFGTASVDLLYCSHVIEHFSYQDGLKLLKEFRRVIKPEGALRISCPDAQMLLNHYANDKLHYFDEVSEGCASSKTRAKKLHELLNAGHLATYDLDTLKEQLAEAGFARSEYVEFRHSMSEAGARILRETLDQFPCLSLYVEALPT